MELHLPVAVVCRVLGTPLHGLCPSPGHTGGGRPGPADPISDHDLLSLVLQILIASPFAGEGYYKLRARLRREHAVHVSGKRCSACCAKRACWRRSGSAAAANPVPMTARSFPGAKPALGTDATMARTRSDGWVVGVSRVDPDTAEAWAHVARVDDRFAASSPSTAPPSTAGPTRPERRPRLGGSPCLGAAVSLGRVHRLAGWLGITDSPAFLGEPETGGTICLGRHDRITAICPRNRALFRPCLPPPSTCER